MAKIFIWPSSNKLGQELLDQYVRPLAQHLGVSLEVPQPNDDRRRLSKAIKDCQVVICDCSVEHGHIYHKYLELPKTNNHVAICSRTPLPRNVYAFHQCAPPHGSRFSNDVLGDWLKYVVPAILSGNYSDGNYLEKMIRSLGQQKTAISTHTGMFTSYRGRLYEKVCKKAEEIGNRIHLPVRVVPKGEFAYETECMTRQQMWATVAMLEREIHWAKGILIVRSEDYLDSFWTASELFITLTFRRKYNGDIEGGILLDESALSPGPSVGGSSFGVTPPTRQEIDEYNRIVRQADPGTVAPEIARETSGLSGVFFKLISAATGHSASPQGDWWWAEVMIPCQNCNPFQRKPFDVNWADHLNLQGYGYFSVPKSSLNNKKEVSVKCPAPNCGKKVELINRREPRTIWIPGPLGQVWPDNMEMISYEDVWEVVV